MLLRSICVLLVFTATGSAVAAPVTGQVIYAAPAAWVLPPPVPTAGVTQPDAPFRFIYNDQQIRIRADGEDIFQAYRLRILKPEALPVGNVTISWNPSSGSATVHQLRIIRDGQPIDILKDQRFQVIQREGGLEQSILNGDLTAMLQVPGLRVGDEIEFAVTLTQHDPTLGDHAFGLGELPPKGMPGAFRYRLSWPDAKSLAWRATRDLPQAAPSRAAGQTSISYELRDPPGVIVNDGAPQRYNIRRLIEFSDFAGWGEISRRFSEVFEKAATLAPASPVHAEAARIMAASADPGERALAALRLVQDQVRYVYVGLDGGNYRPATADETWQRRFGDCKAKTVLLLALLREMKIEAEPVLVNPLGGDGSDARLPSPSIFNHVLVRAKIGDARYWLDGTRLGDRFFDMLPPPSFRWALPLRPAGGELEPVPPKPLMRPQIIGVVEIDATAGFDKPAKVTAQQVIRQDDAFTMRMQLVSMSSDDADRALRGYWHQQMDWVDPDQVAWRYDERRATLLLSLTGEGKPHWEGDAREGRSFDIPGAGFYAPDLRRRPKEQDQTVPWATSFPRFRCYATTIRLPAADPKWSWAYYADPMNLRIGGTAYWRASGLKDSVMRTIMSSHVEKPEIDAEEAKAANDAIPTFNNKVSRVYEVPGRAQAGSNPRGALPFGDGVDWVADAAACEAPAAK